MTLDSIKSDSANSSSSTGGASGIITTIENEPINPQMNSKTTTTTSSDPDPDLICPICKGASISSCRNCKKISYCGKAHQRLHWKLHKSECFPLIHQYDPILGSRLIATRNIKAGEIIWKEKSLLSGPRIINSTILTKQEENEEKSGVVNPNARLCLGCCRVVKRDYSCSSCSWSMCGPNCDGKGDHERLECKIFTREQRLEDSILLRGEGESQRQCWYKYGAITILRGILYRELDPPRWKKILDLDDMWNGGGGVECDNFVKPPTNTSTTDFGQFCHEFIMSLNLSHVVTNEDIALLLGVVSHRQCEVYEDEQLCNLLQHRQHTTTFKPYYGALLFHLFYTACQATQNCVPNSSWIIQQDSNPVEIHLRALLPIQFGRTVTLSYANVEEDIIGRQMVVVAQHGESTTTATTVSCKCARCQEVPNELGTFFSALKCPSCEVVSHHGNSTESLITSANCWLLPTTTTTTRRNEAGDNISSSKMGELMWSCHECGLTLETECYMKVVEEIKKDFCDICCVQQLTSNKNNSGEEKVVGDALTTTLVRRCTLIENLESLIQKHSPSSVHPNHVTMFKVEMMLMSQLSVALAEADLTDENKWTRMVERFTNLCHKWLEVGDVLWPGLSRQRGQLLYYYQQALIIQLIFTISRRMRGGESPEEEDDDGETVTATADSGRGEEQEKEEIKEEIVKSIQKQDLRQIQQSLLEKQFLKILSIRKVVVDIFCYDGVDQVGRKYADSLVRKCPEIELLKLYVFQNSSSSSK